MDFQKFMNSSQIGKPWGLVRAKGFSLSPFPIDNQTYHMSITGSGRWSQDLTLRFVMTHYAFRVLLVI